MAGGVRRECKPCVGAFGGSGGGEEGRGGGKEGKELKGTGECVARERE